MLLTTLYLSFVNLVVSSGFRHPEATRFRKAAFQH